MIPAEFIEPRRLFVRSQRAPGRTAVFHGPVPTAGRAGTRQRRRRRPGDYIFERDATMPGAARGFADVFYRDHFAWGRGGSKYPAWESILNETTQLELLPSQMKQAEPQKAAADGAVTARLPETSQWLLGPTQAKPQDQMTWEALRLSGADALAIRACKKLRSDEFAEEVIAHLAGLVGADMAVTLELQAVIPLERLTTWCAR